MGKRTRSASHVYGPTLDAYEHDLPELYFEWPDLLDSLSPVQRACEVESAPDLCTVFRSRFFVRGRLPIEVLEHRQPWVMGLWVELSPLDFLRHLNRYDSCARGIETTCTQGKLANEVFPGLRLREVDIQVRFDQPGRRPTLWFPRPQPDNPLCLAQRSGMSVLQIQRWIQLVQAYEERAHQRWLH